MTSEDKGHEGGAGDEIQRGHDQPRPSTSALRPAERWQSHLERLGDELERAKRQNRELEAALELACRVRHLLIDELHHAKRQGTTPAGLEELVEALQDACLMVTAGADRSAQVRAAGVNRWIRTIERARGRFAGHGYADVGMGPNLERKG